MAAKADGKMDEAFGYIMSGSLKLKGIGSLGKVKKLCSLIEGSLYCFFDWFFVIFRKKKVNKAKEAKETLEKVEEKQEEREKKAKPSKTPAEKAFEETQRKRVSVQNNVRWGKKWDFFGNF